LALSQRIAASSNGLARIYGTRTPLPDRQDSREYLAHLHELENEAKAAKRGARPLYFERGMGKSSNRALAGNCGQPVALLCNERVSKLGKARCRAPARTSQNKGVQ